jgi:hypothetical protein
VHRLDVSEIRARLVLASARSLTQERPRCDHTRLERAPLMDERGAGAQRGEAAFVGDVDDAIAAGSPRLPLPLAADAVLGIRSKRAEIATPAVAPSTAS